MSCNSSRTTGLRPEIIDNLKRRIPTCCSSPAIRPIGTPSTRPAGSSSVCNFATSFATGRRSPFPTITTSATRTCGARTASGRRSADNADGGYFYPPEYVNLVQRQQTWHLPDPVDPANDRAGHHGLLHAAASRRHRLRHSRRSQVQNRPGRKDSADGAAARPHQRSEVRSEVDRFARPGIARRAATSVSCAVGSRIGRARR